jgi:hypothetical protein
MMWRKEFVGHWRSFGIHDVMPWVINMPIFSWITIEQSRVSEPRMFCHANAARCGVSKKKTFTRIAYQTLNFAGHRPKWGQL